MQTGNLQVWQVLETKQSPEKVPEFRLMNPEISVSTEDQFT